MLIPDPLPQGGVRVPLRASFTGLKGLPLVAFATNNASPLLAVHENGLQGKVIRQWNKPLSAIEEVSTFQTLGARNLIITWRGSRLTFTANVRTDEWLRAVLEFLDSHDMPLSDAARSAMQGGDVRFERRPALID